MNPPYVTGIIDVSHWDAQAHQDLSADLRAAMSMDLEPVCAVIAKATQGKDGIDPAWMRWTNACRKNGTLFGAYHFLSASEDGDLQANWFLENVKDAGWDPRMITLAMDYETNPNVGGTATIDHVRHFAIRIHDVVGRYPVLYSNQARVQHQITDPNDVLVKCPLWIAVYGGTSPIIPAGYSAAGKSWTLWQYTDGFYCAEGLPKETERFPRCDRSVWRGTLDGLRQSWPI
jgi:lysozyme